MGRLTQRAVIEADIAVRRMSHDQKVRLADEIYAEQPNMLASILALPRMGVDMAHVGGGAARPVRDLPGDDAQRPPMAPGHRGHPGYVFTGYPVTPGGACR